MKKQGTSCNFSSAGGTPLDRGWVSVSRCISSGSRKVALWSVRWLWGQEGGSVVRKVALGSARWLCGQEGSHDWSELRK